MKNFGTNGNNIWHTEAMVNGTIEYPIKEMPYKYPILTFNNLIFVIKINELTKRNKMTVVNVSSIFVWDRATDEEKQRKNKNGPTNS